MPLKKQSLIDLSNCLIHSFLLLQMEEIVKTEIDPLKIEVCDTFPVQTGSYSYTMEDLEQSSLEEKVDLGNLVLFPPDSYVNKETETEEVKFVIKEETSEINISDKAVIMEEVIEPPVHEYEKTQIEFSTNSNVKCQTCRLEFGNKAVLKIHNSILHPEGPKMLAQQSTDKNGEKSPTQNYSGQEKKFEYVILNEERLLIAQQMRQHIQLLTQMSLLTAKDDYWQELHTDCRGMLSELMNRSFNQQYSIYAQDNLFPSIQVYYLRTLEYMDRTLKLPNT